MMASGVPVAARFSRRQRLSGIALHRLNKSSVAEGQVGRLQEESDNSDNWKPERLGRYMTNPLLLHQRSIAHRPGQVSTQKHTLGLEYFRSGECRSLLKVAYEGAVSVRNEQGEFISVAQRHIKAGEIIERGILRGVDGDTLDEEAPNRGILRLGQDFMTSAGFPWTSYSMRAGPPFLPSGNIPFYTASQVAFNVEVKAKESHFEGFEFDVVATEDIPKDCPLVRKVAKAAPVVKTQYAETYDLSEENIDSYVNAWGALDLDNAVKAGTTPDIVHEAAIREHARLTRGGLAPVVDCRRTACLPHPAWGGFGVFATQDIKAGELVEAGLMVPIIGLSGTMCSYVFTWNKGGQRYTDRPNNWCLGVGNAMFYNSDVPANVRMYRFLNQHRYLIVAKTDIKEGEEVMHLYASSSWRKCFVQDRCLPKLLPIDATAQE